jgi:hypothetical protein
MTTSRSTGPVASERQALLADLAHQRDLLRQSLDGLTHEQAMCTPTISSLSLAGVIKRAAETERHWIAGVVGQRGRAGLDGPSGFNPHDGFRLEPDGTLADVIGLYTAVAEETEAIVAGIADLGEMVRVPAGPLSLRSSSDPDHWPLRSVVLHVADETAGHVRAAGILRGILERRSGQRAAPVTAHGATSRAPCA